MIQFETQVIRVEQDDTKIQNEWAVTTLDLRSQSQLTQSYDAVVVASGHYTIPFIPETKGIHAWSEKYPGVITHSKFFRRPEDLKNKVRGCLFPWESDKNKATGSPLAYRKYS